MHPDYSAILLNSYDTCRHVGDNHEQALKNAKEVADAACGKVKVKDE